LARRATFFKTERANPDTVIVSAGHEFAPFGFEQDRHPSIITQLKKAYSLLNYDIFLLSPRDAMVFEKTGIPAAESWQGPLTEPKLVVRKVSGGSIAIVLFPDHAATDSNLNQSVVNFAKDLRNQKRYNLIIGVSTWGASREQLFIESSPPVFDILLGSGEGPGYNGLYMQNNGLLWVRAFTKGRSVQSVSIPKLPVPEKKMYWNPEVSIHTRSHALGGEVATDGTIAAVFNP
jgi:hypothetical protein